MFCSCLQNLLTTAEEASFKNQEAKLIEEIKTLTSLCGQDYQSEDGASTNLDSNSPSAEPGVGSKQFVLTFQTQ